MSTKQGQQSMASSSSGKQAYNVGSSFKDWFFTNSSSGGQNGSSGKQSGGGLGDYIRQGCSSSGDKSKDMRGMNVWMPQTL